MCIYLISTLNKKVLEFREYDSYFSRSNISSEVSYKQWSVFVMTNMKEINENVLNDIKIET